MAVEHVFAGIAVKDLGRALAWYERLLGREPDLVPHDEESAWQLAGAAWIYVILDPGRAAGHALLTVLVDDLDAQVAALAGRGLVTEPIETLPGVFRKAAIADPEGNRITFAQPFAQTEPR